MVASFGYIFIVFFFCFCEICECHKLFRKYIPNGYNVPDPCTHDPNDVWHRVGHSFSDFRNQPKDKPKNNFGKDFVTLKNSLTSMVDIWNGTAEIPGLCRMDSDGDERTNGQELGDPDCKWKVKGIPLTTDRSQLSHPGIPDSIGGIKNPENAKLYCLG